MIPQITKQMSNGSKSRNWCFTHNNPQSHELSFPSNVKYAVWQLESGAEGTPHLQGYVELATPRSLHYMRNIIPGAHWEVRVGTSFQARNYCMKEESRIDGPWEHGTYQQPNPGRRSDLEEIKNLLDAGVQLSEIYSKHFTSSARYYRFFDRYLLEKRPHRTEPPEVYILCGKTGTGKSRFCVEHGGGPQYWKTRGDWWDAYANEPICVIDEFYGWLPFDFILRLLDRYPLDVPVKGGFRRFTSSTVFITSNRPPWEWWKSPKDQTAFQRRIKSVTHFESSELKYTFTSLDEYKSFYYLMNFK